MPNGFQGSAEEWRKMESPLLRIDPVLAAFATQHKMLMGENCHNWPERSLKWSSGGVERLIQIWPAEGPESSYHLWICAWEDLGGERYWKSAFIKQRVPWPEIEKDLPALLITARAAAEAWTHDDLELAGNVGGGPHRGPPGVM